MTAPVRRVRRPTKVKVGWMEYDILWVSHQMWPAGRQSSLGVTFSNRSEILMREGDEESPVYSEIQLRETLLHEILHAVYHVTNLTTNPVQTDNPEEYVVGVLAGPVLAVLRDNPKVLAYLLA